MTCLWPQAFLLAVSIMMTSCSLNSTFDEVKPAQVENSASSKIIVGPPIKISYPITVGRIDLFIDASNYVSGTVTVQIRSADGSTVLGSTTVSGASLLKGNMVRNTFLFSPAVSLSSNQKYRIYLTRSSPHNYMSDYLYWRTSSSGVDAYTRGVPDVFINSGWVLDYAFVTYSDGFVDQQQTSTNYGFFVSNDLYRWQEFVPQKIWVAQP